MRSCVLCSAVIISCDRPQCYCLSRLLESLESGHSMTTGGKPIIHHLLTYENQSMQQSHAYWDITSLQEHPKAGSDLPSKSSHPMHIPLLKSCPERGAHLHRRRSWTVLAE